MKIAHYHRFPDYDYSRGASLFCSVSTAPRRRLFGDVGAGGVMALSPFGREVFVAIEFTFAKAPGFTLFGHTVMPDHCHFRFYFAPGVENARAAALINTTVGRFKSYTTHLYQTKYGGHGALWQEGFHDWLCLSREMIDSVERYIEYNALKWWLRHGGRSLAAEGQLLKTAGGGEALPKTAGGSEAPPKTAGGGEAPPKTAGGGVLTSAASARCDLRLHEPLKSPRLGQSEFWRGVGAIDLLNADRPMVALRVSRRCSPAEVGALARRIAAKAGEFTVLSGFISPGEREVLAALLANPAATIVKISPYALPHDYSPPVTLMPAIAEGRLAVIARGNSPAEISRAACLDYNARIIDIADKAAYARPGSLSWR